MTENQTIDFDSVTRILNGYRADSDGHKEYELKFTLDPNQLIYTIPYALRPVRKVAKIILNRERLNCLTVPTVAFLIAHEFGHVTLEHNDPCNKEALTKAKRHMQEYHADQEAMALCKRAGFRIEKRHLDELDMIPEFQIPTTFTHPAWEIRKGALINDWKL